MQYPYIYKLKLSLCFYGAPRHEDI